LIDFTGRVVVLTGAGVSAESGISTFRGAGGLWRTYRATDLATPQAFLSDPQLVWEFYDWRRTLIAGCQPNPAHKTIAEMEQRLPHFTLITQNIDGLHQRAGSQKVLTLHGDIWRVRCTVCNDQAHDWRVPLPEIPPRCIRCGSLLRPDVVWFGESLPGGVLQAAWAASSKADLMLVVGTSALVQPAASLPLIAKQNGAAIIEINPDATPLTPYADEALRGPAGEILPGWWDKFQEGEKPGESKD
jgi:NAD-dependent deacetylase